MSEIILRLLRCQDDWTSSHYQLGEGAFSHVYEWHEKWSHKVYAAKILCLEGYSASAMLLFQQEARICRTLSSPFIPKVTEVKEANNLIAIVMEKCEGTLQSYALNYQEEEEEEDHQLSHKKEPPSPILTNIPEKEIWDILARIVGALADLHSQDRPILHRDIKPENILLAKDGWKLSDFGTVFELTEPSSTIVSSKYIGTPLYFSPERLNKDGGRYGLPSDIWSLGCAIYKACYRGRKTPYRGKSAKDLQKNVERNEVLRIPSLYSNELWRVIASMLEKRPEKRPSAQELSWHSEILPRLSNTTKTPFKAYSERIRTAIASQCWD